MKIRAALLETSAVNPAQWPAEGLPEIAFVGRSNVGKSSLLNRLLGRKSLARVSARPGKTQTINFYRINDSFRLVDLPGYGYAKVSQQERRAFVKMLDSYLRKRESLVRVVHLIDIRHDPTKDDLEGHRWLMSLGVPLCVVATKMDKVSKSKAAVAVQNIRKQLSTPYPVVAVSAEKGMNIDQLWEILEADIAELPLSAQADATLPTDGGIRDQHAEKDEDSADSLPSAE
jgi:GTP-binding protein